LPKLRLLRGLGANGLANVGQLPCGGLTKLSALRFQVAQLAACLHAKGCLLACLLRGLLSQCALRLSVLSVQPADALHQLRLLSRLLALRLLELRHLHGCLSVKASFLEALLRRLHSKLTLLSCELTLQACLLARQLCGLLAKASLLRGRACLELPSLGQLLRRRLAKASLLRGNA
jgi:hypothetical protein